jgi:hypothetical protein
MDQVPGTAGEGVGAVTPGDEHQRRRCGDATQNLHVWQSRRAKIPNRRPKLNLKDGFQHLLRIRALSAREAVANSWATQ